MSREIKFRTWDESTNTMYMDSLVGNSGKLVAVEYTTEENDLELLYNTYENGMHPEQFILMQFSGIKDYKGKEVYEGDICRFDTENGIVIAEVYFKECSDENEWVSGLYFKFLRHEEYDGDNGVEFEIIGNIYENGELLND